MQFSLSPGFILLIVALYFGLLMIVSYFTGKDSGNDNFFIAGRKSPWYLVAFGMIGASLSGVTFISIPGVVGAGKGNMDFSYMQMVFGYLVGYFVIATVLMPVYYKLNLTTIYGYLQNRFGEVSYKTGSGFFLLSRTIGASFRLYLVAIVLQKFVMEPFGLPFWATVLITILLIWIYTFRGGIKTIVWTDTLQTFCMLAAVILTVIAIAGEMNVGVGQIPALISESEYSQLFFFENGWSDPNNFFKQFISGALIALVMTGLDQDMMQKNLTCKTLGDAQKNMFWFSIILVFANILFLGLGALLYIYANQAGIEIPAKTDQLFPTIALEHLSPAVGILFVLGLVAAAYSSADSALTSLTTAFCVDFLGFKTDKVQATLSGAGDQEKVLDADESTITTNKFGDENKKTRFLVHIGFSALLFFVILVFYAVNDTAVISQVFVAAGFTYGPLLGLFTFGLATKRVVKDNLVLFVCLLAPVISYFLNKYSAELFGGFTFGFLILLVNGALTFLGLWLVSSSEEKLA